MSERAAIPFSVHRPGWIDEFKAFIMRGNVVDLAVGIPGASLASHVGIFATTGMGKSNLMQVLAGGVMQANGRYGLLIVDPHGEYRTALGRHP